MRRWQGGEATRRDAGRIGACGVAFAHLDGVDWPMLEGAAMKAAAQRHLNLSRTSTRSETKREAEKKSGKDISILS